jgi:hypothetical protein
MEGKWPYPSWLRRLFLGNVYSGDAKEKFKSDRYGIDNVGGKKDIQVRWVWN